MRGQAFSRFGALKLPQVSSYSSSRADDASVQHRRRRSLKGEQASCQPKCHWPSLRNWRTFRVAEETPTGKQAVHGLQPAFGNCVGEKRYRKRESKRRFVAVPRSNAAFLPLPIRPEPETIHVFHAALQVSDA